MARKLLTSIIITSLLFLLTSVHALSRPKGHHTSKVKLTQQQQLMSGEVIAWLIVLNKNEMKTATLALKYSHNQTIKDYADRLLKNHKKNLGNLLHISQIIEVPPIATQKVDKMIEAGSSDITKLSKINRDGFDVAFINTMINDHSKILRNINQNFLGYALDKGLKQHLQIMRAQVSRSLKEEIILETKVHQKRGSKLMDATNK